MRLFVNAQTLRRALERVSVSCPKRSPKAILTHVKLDCGDNTLSLISYDLEQHTSVSINIDQHHAGECLVPLASLLDFVKQCKKDADVTLSLQDNGTLLVTCGDWTKQLPTGKLDEFPIAPTADKSVMVELPANQLRQAIKTLLPAIDANGRFALSGIAFDATVGRSLYLVGTDGYRLHCWESHTTTRDEHKEVYILPYAACVSLDKLLAPYDLAADSPLVTIFVSTNELHFSVGTFNHGQTTFRSRLIEGRFPMWRNAVPTYSRPVYKRGKASELSATIKAVSCTPKEYRDADCDSFFMVNAELNGMLRVERDLTKDIAACEVSGVRDELVKVSLNPFYVRDFLDSLPKGAEVEIVGEEETSPIRLVYGWYWGMVMPMAKGKK